MWKRFRNCLALRRLW